MEKITDNLYRIGIRDDETRCQGFGATAPCVNQTENVVLDTQNMSETSYCERCFNRFKSVYSTD